MSQALAVVALDPAGTVGVRATLAREGERQEGNRRDRAQRRVVLGCAGGKREQGRRRDQRLGPTSIVRAPQPAAWVSSSAIAGLAGPSGASAMTTASGPSIVAAPEVISQTSAPSAWTSAISLSLSAASSAAG